MADGGGSGSACFHRAWRDARAMVSPKGGEGIFVIEARTIVARLLVVLALIVQIVAPTAASVAMVTATTDPLAGAWICGHDGATPDEGSPTADACRLCDLVCHGGSAETPAAPVDASPASRAVDVVRAPEQTDLDVGASPAAFHARGPPQNA